MNGRRTRTPNVQYALGGKRSQKQVMNVLGMGSHHTEKRTNKNPNPLKRTEHLTALMRTVYVQRPRAQSMGAQAESHDC